MSQNQSNPIAVYVVTCYQNIVGVYAKLDVAVQVVKDGIAKNRPYTLQPQNLL